MSNNTTEIKISRSVTSYSSRVNAIMALDDYDFHPGEMVAVTYNAGSNKLNVLFAVGIGDRKYKLVSLLQNRIVKGVLEGEPANKTDYLWTNGNKWFLGEDPLSLYPGIIINDINSQTFYAVSLDGQTPRQINNVYDRGELLEKTGTIISNIVQADWNEEDMLSPSFIRNKPSNLDGFEEDIRYSLVRIDNPDPTFITYALQKTKADAEPEIVGNPINIPYDSSIVSGTVKVVNIEDKQPEGIFYDEDEYEVGDHYLDLAIEIGTDLFSHVYILMKFLTDVYEAGFGINIENKQISLKIIEQRGLRVDQEKGLTIDPATSTSSGAMTSEMKQRLDNITEDDYVSINSGDNIIYSIEPKISKTSLDIESPPSDYLIYETPGFLIRPNIGIDTGFGELLQVRGSEIQYDINDRRIPVATELCSVGDNSCDPSRVVPGVKLNQRGIIESDNTKSIVYFYCLSTPYSIFSRSDENLVIGFSFKYINLSNIGSTVDLILKKDEYGHYTPPSEGILYICTDLMSVSDVCARISGDGTMDGVYAPYTKTNIFFNIVPESIRSFVYEDLIYDDLIENIGGVLYCTKTYGKKTFTTADWGNRQSEVVVYDGISITRYFYNYVFESGSPTMIKPFGNFIVERDGGEKVNGIEIVSTNSGFRYYVPESSTTLEPELLIIYELNDPITYELETNPKYPVYKYGVETELDSLDLIMSDSKISLSKSIKTRYTPNLLNDLISLKSDLEKKVSKYSVDDQMSDSSKNPVQCKVVKDYVDSLISSYSTADIGDLSKQDFFGNPKTMNTANCYVLTNKTTNVSGTYRFPLVYGNAIKNGGDNNRAYNSFVNHLGDLITSPWIDDSFIGTTGVLWKSSYCTVSSPTITTASNGIKYISFTASNGDGNAVIYLKDSQNRIVWTWHIWEQIHTLHYYTTTILTPLKIWNKIDIETSGTEYSILPVFLGYSISSSTDELSGIYYQWGRKDPFNPEITGFNVNYTTTTTENSIQNPQTFFINNSWNSSSDIHNYWDYNGAAPNSFGDYCTGKTIYDPSPAGWKVPNSNIFRGFMTTGLPGETVFYGNIKNSYRPSSSTVTSMNYGYGYDFKCFARDNINLGFPLFNSIGNLSSTTISNLGSHGYYWSATQGCSLEFSEDIINPIKSMTPLSYGFPIHPILE